jgi:hypothetical protein
MNKYVLAGVVAVLVTLAGAAAYIFRDDIAGARAHFASRVTVSVPSPAQPAAPPGAPPVTPVDYQPVTPQTAEEINGAVPIESVGPAAKPFRIEADSATWDRAAKCLAQAVYYEAGAESPDGQRAVAQVVLNRVRSPAFPSSICGVVYQGAERSTGCQFTFTCDGSLNREPTSAGWRRALSVATSALHGQVYAPVGNATHYHANYVVPYWAASMAKIRAIGAHDFYRWPGSWRAATFFSQRYANFERQPNMGMAAAGLPAPASASPAATEVATPALAADAISASRHSPAVALAIDRTPHTLVAGEKPSGLNPGLNRINILAADLEGAKLEPTPSLRVREH